MRKEDTDAIKVRADKYLGKHELYRSDINKLCDAVEALRIENSLLRQNLFELEQKVPEDQQWQNVIANKLERALLANDGKDYLEINNSINNSTFTISIQKKFGKTPVQLLKQSEIRRLKALNKIVGLLNELKKLRSVCFHNRIEMDLLRSIGRPSVDEELLSREKIATTIRALADVIKSYNHTVYGRQVQKLHTSMKQTLQEAVTRASHCEWKFERLQEEHLKLKKDFIKRKALSCGLYKKQRRKRGTRRRLALHL